MEQTQAVSLFKGKFSMYANAPLEARLNGTNWDIYIEGSDTPVGYVMPDGVAHLY